MAADAHINTTLPLSITANMATLGSLAQMDVMAKLPLQTHVGVESLGTVVELQIEATLAFDVNLTVQNIGVVAQAMISAALPLHVAVVATGVQRLQQFFDTSWDGNEVASIRCVRQRSTTYGCLVTVQHSTRWDARRISSNFATKWSGNHIQWTMPAVWDSALAFKSAQSTVWDAATGVRANHAVVWDSALAFKSAQSTVWDAATGVRANHAVVWDSALAFKSAQSTVWDAATGVRANHAVVWDSALAFKSAQSTVWDAATGVRANHAVVWDSALAFKSAQSTVWDAATGVRANHAVVWESEARLHRSCSSWYMDADAVLWCQAPSLSLTIEGQDVPIIGQINVSQGRLDVGWRVETQVQSPHQPAQLGDVGVLQMGTHTLVMVVQSITQSSTDIEGLSIWQIMSVQQALHELHDTLDAIPANTHASVWAQTATAHAGAWPVDWVVDRQQRAGWAGQTRQSVLSSLLDAAGLDAHRDWEGVLHTSSPLSAAANARPASVIEADFDDAATNDSVLRPTRVRVAFVEPADAISIASTSVERYEAVVALSPLRPLSLYSKQGQITRITSKLTRVSKVVAMVDGVADVGDRIECLIDTKPTLDDVWWRRGGTFISTESAQTLAVRVRYDTLTYTAEVDGIDIDLILTMEQDT